MLVDIDESIYMELTNTLRQAEKTLKVLSTLQSALLLVEAAVKTNRELTYDQGLFIDGTPIGSIIQNFRPKDA